MTSRRHFLASVLATSVLPHIGWAAAGSPAYLAAAAEGDNYALFGLDEGGGQIFRIPLPARGHAAAAHPSRPEAVGFARRPGIFALVIDCRDGGVLHRLTPPEGRQFNGHGAFSGDGGLLFTSEVVAETSEGRIGIWDAAEDYLRIGEWASGGVGPHDLRRFGDALIVANGGIKTDPSDRSKLNIDSMRPNLALVRAGRVEEMHELAPEFAQASIRHLAPIPNGVAFAMQWEGDPAETVPLLGLWHPGQAPVLCPASEYEAVAMKGYAGSIACDPISGQIAITSPKGGVVQVFAANGAFLTTLRRPDACGVAAAAGGFLLTDGNGAISRIGGTPPVLRAAARVSVAWDNHLISVA